MARRTKTASAATTTKTSNLSGYLTILQSQINTDIQAVKAGMLGEDLLRRRAMDAPEGKPMQLVLWLNALVTGVIDDLKVIVKEGPDGPDFVFIPDWTEGYKKDVQILHLPIPGPNPSGNRAAAPALPVHDPDELDLGERAG